MGAAGSRRREILQAGAELFAAHGFHGASIGELGRAVGTTGPALYRHFPGKQALLAAILLDISERLAVGAERRLAEAASPEEALDSLLRGHIEFALTEPALITVHERELVNVPEEERRRIRRIQRGYLERWVEVLTELRPGLSRQRLRAVVHAAFGLLNSTPHSAADLPADEMAEVLLASGRAALLA